MRNFSGWYVSNSFGHRRVTITIVPLHALHTQEPWLVCLQVLPERVCVVTIDLDLLHDGELDAVVYSVLLVSSIVL